MPLPPSFAPRRPAGVALVLVLSLLVLVTVLAVAFFSSITTEVSSSKTYAGSTSARQLADDTVSLVMSQVRDATAGVDAAGNSLAWASQPGLIHTWDAAGGVGTQYKLYSSNQLTAAGDYDPAADLPPATLDFTRPNALYTDLNAPVLTTRVDPATQKPVPLLSYPIVDGNGLVTLGGGLTYSTDGVNPDVEGFSIVANAPGQSAGQPAPMFVRWLYVLQNGMFAAPAAGADGTQANFAAAAAVPTADNPIVGRVAFWTDDESAKINVNTASEGVFWDVPRATAIRERDNKGPDGTYGFGWAIPALNEFQRVPGHPATTSLSAALGAYLPRPSPLLASDYAGRIKPYYDLAPRLADGGTRGGTVLQSPTAARAVALDGDRLFASVDELMFAAPLTGGGSVNRNGNLIATPATLDRVALERSAFFLTATSRAPEVTLLNTPRVGIWPVQALAADRNAKDNLLAFCTSLAGTGATPQAYYFQRANTYKVGLDASSSQSQSQDINLARNQTVFHYLQGLMNAPVPGFSQSGAVTLAAKFGGAGGRDQLLAEIFDYVRAGVNTYVTGVDPANPYSYSPGSTNPYYHPPGNGSVVPTTTNGVPGISNSRGFGRYPTLREVALVFYAADFYHDVAPTPDVPPVSVADGGSRVPYTREVRVAVLPNPYSVSPGQPNAEPSVRYVIKGLNNLKAHFQGGAPVAFFTRTSDLLGARGTSRDSRTPLTGLRRIMLGTNTGGNNTARVPPGTAGADEFTIFPFVADAGLAIPRGDVTQPYAPAQFVFDGGHLDVEIHSGVGAAPGDLLQTLHLDFPAATLPVPTVRQAHYASNDPNYYNSDYDAQNVTDPTNPLYYCENSLPTWQFYNRWTGNLTANEGAFVKSGFLKRGDTVRSVEISPDGPSGGDVRLVAALADVPSAYFGPHHGAPGNAVKYDYADPGLSQVHSLRTGRSGDVPGYDAPGFAGVPPNGSADLTDTPKYTENGSLVPGVDYTSNSNKYFNQPSAAVFGQLGTYQDPAAKTLPGDWDNGIGNLDDGPFINKPDEAGFITYNDYTASTYDRAYFSPDSAQINESGVSYSPSRQIASPVMFGSLPTGVSANPPQPWRTLLFCPNPAAGAAHPGFGTLAANSPAALTYSVLPDHLLLDFFTMPVVEPYAISEPFSTAGKINLNYRIAPFSYLRRSTGLRAVLKAMQLAAIPTQAVRQDPGGAFTVYKTDDIANNLANGPFQEHGRLLDIRYDLNLDETLRGIDARLFPPGGGPPGLFRSASEVCTVLLVPRAHPGSNYLSGAPAAPSNYEGTAAWWSGFQGTGDNTREAPYNQIYPRLTTKSNTFRVHMITQVLKKRPNSPPTLWEEGRDAVVSEYRGSAVLERYVDPGDPTLPDFAAGTNANGTPAAPADLVIDKYYRFRVLSTKQFNP